MPAWLIGLIASLALPVLKALLKSILLSLEKTYPGIAPLVDAILKFLENGGKADVLQAHIESVTPQTGLSAVRENTRL